jgi:hypothetical protein
LASEFDFGDFGVDLRRYVPLRPNHVLAIQALGIHQRGAVPFSELAAVGAFLRGIDPERIRDKSVVMCQSELRLPIRGRFGGVVFGGVGMAGPSIDRIETSSPLWAGGLGLRVAFDPARRVNFRFDIGLSEFGVQPYFQFQEAF